MKDQAKELLSDFVRLDEDNVEAAEVPASEVSLGPCEVASRPNLSYKAELAKGS